MLVNALGLIEVVGLAAGLEAADAAVKAANVDLIGYELTRGGGMVVIKLTGDVGAVKAAVEAAAAAASKVGKVYAVHVIPRPSANLEKIIITGETVGQKPRPPAEPVHPEEAPRPEKVPAEEELALPEEDSYLIEEQMPTEDETPAAEYEGALEPSNNVSPKVSCNLCGDPACPRRKGDPRVSCIHYNEDDKED